MEIKWIPLTEKRPEKSGLYLVSGKEFVCDTIHNKDIIIRRTGVAEYKCFKDDSFWVLREWHQDLNPFQFRHLDDNDILLTAWMPLLEPYDETTKEI